MKWRALLCLILCIPAIVLAQSDESREDNGLGTISEKKVAEPAFGEAFFKSLSMIITSELGDKTFFIAAIMAGRFSRVEIFSAAIAALAAMTILSVAIGQTVSILLPFWLSHYASVLLFAFFGVQLLRSASEMKDDEPNEELEEVEQALLENGEAVDLEAGASKTPKAARDMRKILHRFFSPTFVQCFVMTFLAEWGDRSQIATFTLSVTYNPLGVTVGGVIGHALCTGLAVLGGKYLATRISEKTVAYIGGALFMIFALHGLIVGPEH